MITDPGGKDEIVILANGQFPQSEHGIRVLGNARMIICCDEAADHLIASGREPDLIIGDMDSVSAETLQKFSDRVITIEEQESNDLTKAVQYCIDNRFASVTILGATGLREDHTLGNISLLLEYNREIPARMITEHGEISTLKSGERVPSYPGEKISFFSVDNNIHVTSEGLKYPLVNMRLHNWWRASLNEVTTDHFMLHFKSEWPLLLFRNY